MIVVSVQYTDLTTSSGSLYNGGFGQHFYNLSEAKTFAESESTPIPGHGTQMAALCRVYNDGILVEAWENGVNITP
jgi:hypothetical protein